MRVFVRVEGERVLTLDMPATATVLDLKDALDECGRATGIFANTATNTAMVDASAAADPPKAPKRITAHADVWAVGTDDARPTPLRDGALLSDTINPDHSVKLGLGERFHVVLRPKPAAPAVLPLLAAPGPGVAPAPGATGVGVASAVVATLSPRVAAVDDPARLAQLRGWMDQPVAATVAFDAR